MDFKMKQSICSIILVLVMFVAMIKLNTTVLWTESKIKK